MNWVVEGELRRLGRHTGSFCHFSQLGKLDFNLDPLLRPQIEILIPFHKNHPHGIPKNIAYLMVVKFMNSQRDCPLQLLNLVAQRKPAWKTL